MHFQTIYSTVRATRGIQSPKETTNKGGFVAFVKKVFGNLPWYEYVWYGVFVVAGILCLTLFPYSPLLLVSVISLYVYMVASNLEARGMKAGLYVSLLSTGIYVAVCIITHVWGEVISNLLIYVPLCIIAIFKWNRLQSDDGRNELKVSSFGLIDWWFNIAFIGAGTIGLGLFLQKVMDQSYAYINALLIFFSLAGTFARNNGKREVWLFYILSDVLSVVLWVLISKEDGWDTIPYIVSSVSSLFNSIIGIIEWRKLRLKNHETVGNYLAVKRKRVTNIIKLRRQFQNLHWTLVSDENWKKRIRRKVKNK